MDELPQWSDGAVAVLSTAGGDAHAIPVSTALRAGPRTVLVALARRRDSLARLRRDPRIALTMFGPGVACTAHARAVVLEEPLAESDGVAAVRLDVTRIQDHLTPRLAIEQGVRWRWADDDARARDAAVRAGLRRLAGPAPTTGG